MITRSDINKDQDFLIKISIRMGYFLTLSFVNILLVIVFRNNSKWIEFLNSSNWDFLGSIIYYSLYPLIVLAIIAVLIKYYAISRMKSNQKLLEMRPMDLLAYQAEKIKETNQKEP